METDFTDGSEVAVIAGCDVPVISRGETELYFPK